MSRWRRAWSRAAVGVVLTLFGPVVRADEPAAAAGGFVKLWSAPLPDLREGRAESYSVAVESLVGAFEAQLGLRIQPGEKARVGLKVYAESGPGLATPVPLVRAVIDALVRRGYAVENIFLIGLNQLQLQVCGFLPPLGGGADPFPRQKVYVLESAGYYDAKWFYENPLPSRFDPFLAQSDDGADQEAALEENRKSFLATPLFLDADFWINLPAYSDHQVLGVNGALVNATLWNASNTARFFRSESNAPAAVAEMSAIPELRQTWLFTLASLERYQFVGGPWFNSLYTASEPTLLLGTDPVMMDTFMQTKIDTHRVEAGFKPVSPGIRTLEFAEKLGVGTRRVRPPVEIATPGETP
ncbi:MAG: DUF362 domain-containing protein [Verrucomicrobiota bacterium]